MNKTWFAQLVVTFVLAAVAGLYVMPRTLSEKEMNQIVGACGWCTRTDSFRCTAGEGQTAEFCAKFYDKCDKLKGCWISKNEDDHQCPTGCLPDIRPQACTNGM